MPRELVEFLLPNPAINRLLLLGDVVVLAAIGWAFRTVLGLLVSIPLTFLGLIWLGMATNDFFLALVLFHLICGMFGLLTLRRHRQRWVAIMAGGLLIGAPLLGLLT